MISASGKSKVRLFDPGWTHDKGLAVRAPIGSPERELRRFLSDPSSASPPGFYAVVSEGPEHLVAAVDRIRSIPLFFGKRNDGGFRLSDRAQWVREEIAANSVLRGARDDFLLAGYVTGANTLVDGVLQLQAGQYLDARETEGDVRVTVRDHFIFKRTYDYAASPDVLESELEQSVDAVMARFVGYADDRQIVVPLSGGNDSRIIATYLARLCPDRVVTFAYGRSGWEEVEISRGVARALGLPWHFVEGTRKFWLNLQHSAAANEFLRARHQYTSAPYMQDWPAVWALKESGMIEEDAVIAPGHSGDVPTGGMMLPELLSEAGRPSTASAIRNFHYCLWPYDMLETTGDGLEGWIERTSLPSSWGYGPTLLDAVGAGDSWNWRERQAKWLVNSLRGMEEVDLSWWMPLWDDEFTRFWMGVPLEHLRGRTLYRRFVQRKFAEVSGCQIPNYEHRTSLGNRVLKSVKQKVPDRARPFLRRRFRQVVPASPGFGEMGWENWVDPRILESYGDVGSNITSFAALQTLLALEQSLPGVVPDSMQAD